MRRNSKFQWWQFLLLIMLVTACAAPAAADASTNLSAPVVEAIASTEPAGMPTVTATPPVTSESTAISGSAGYAADGTLTLNGDSIRMFMPLTRTDRIEFGSAHVYVMIEGQDPLHPTCEITFHGGAVECTLPNQFSSLTVKVTDDTHANESCSFEIPVHSMTSESIPINAECQFSQ